MSTLDDIRAREAREELGRLHERTMAEADLEAEERARREADQLVTDRRVEREFAFTHEVATLAAERGGTFATTWDVARAEANLATREGAEYDRAAVADVLASDPVPVDDAYQPIR